MLLRQCLNHLLGLLGQFVVLKQIDFRQNNHKGLVLEQRLDILE
jgi:hypothetical protein